MEFDMTEIFLFKIFIISKADYYLISIKSLFLSKANSITDSLLFLLSFYTQHKYNKNYF